VRSDPSRSFHKDEKHVINEAVYSPKMVLYLFFIVKKFNRRTKEIFLVRCFWRENSLKAFHTLRHTQAPFSDLQIC
jgi:hypothetical protein